MTIKYFAYGSNMLEGRLRQRCPSARVLAVSQLKGWALSMHKRSKDGSGKATIAPSSEPSTSVFGVLYEIDSDDLDPLDRAEGHGRGYNRVSIKVAMASSGETVTAITYLAEEGAIDSSLYPYNWYVKLIVAGAKEHALPHGYIEQLSCIHAKADPVLARPSRRQALALLKEWENR
ncbi:gamma-glutamylcyclotransferase [Rhodobacter sp. NTK016B]|uniref:gamma-glutamylcyclotransferase family protein n=1 Tax=Rhodobacter sp. NTK016B TaxID=2759676 RepID=UPI001A8C058C|nr:gamma-glutamylcyclotransferase family protein [Rhodobacter sp. NTK016B]MBN8291434.1 gamma-glutamylcyclotransferase [Rhodobacter sp. NTK016B]